LLAGSAIVSDLYILDTVGSTNDELRRLAAPTGAEGAVLIAGEQKAGRGRLGRHWYSPPGLGLYISIMLRPRRPPREVTRWTIGASLAACEACREAAGCVVDIDWPNDIRFGERKLGGILAEMRSAGRSSHDLVIGLGLNVNHGVDDFPLELRSGATSLRMAAGSGELEMEGLAAEYLLRLEEISAQLQRGEWEPVARRWERMAPGCRGRMVRLASDGFEGLTSGIDADGGLLVRNGDGVTAVVRMADAIQPVES
jgi:BirA family biotin operon repressor/biotin-[acetyl-CoA-carboxylase] ligase